MNDDRSRSMFSMFSVTLGKIEPNKKDHKIRSMVHDE